jgi:gliding motility-associated-like protein
MRLYALLVVMICLGRIQAQDNTFYRKYNLSGMQGGLQLEATQDGGFVATGQHEGNGSAGSCDIYVYRVDACGNNLWFKLIGNGGTDGGKSIKQTSDGGYIVAGHYDSGAGFLMRMNDGGDIIWTKGYTNIQWVFYANETANGDFICLGHRDGFLFVFRTNSVGEVLWSKSIDGMGGMGFYITELPNGDFIFTSAYGIAGKDVGIGRISAGGNFIYGKAYGGSGWSDGDHTNWSCRGLLVDNGESIVVTSPTYQGNGYEDVLLLKASTDDGSVIWSSAFGGGGSDQSRDIALHPLGYAIVGNSNSFPVSASSDPDVLSHDMGERDVLLINVDFDGDLRWARTYGGNDRDRGIGVSYNVDNGFTMSAFSSSSFFGNGGVMDPVFIKTDSIGMLTCQVSTPPLNQVPLNLSVSDVGSLGPYSITNYNLAPIISDYTPNDTYVCQSCFTEPLYQPSDTIICVNEEVDFVNTTSVGLTCFQNWVIEGQTFSGEQDTLTYAFDEPGLYEVELYSTCGNQDNTYVTNIYVYETTAVVNSVSDYNGFEVSCFGENDGAISVSASGGYLPVGSSYDWYWNALVPQTSSIGNLTAGEYTVIATDTQGCADTLVIELNEPEVLSSIASVTSDYNGYNISCFGYNDGEAQIVAQGGVAPYVYSWTSGSAANSATGLNAAAFECTVTDANGCQTADGVQLSEPTQLEGLITLVSDYNGYEISCFGADDGQAVFEAEGGVMPYAIIWNGQPYTIGAVMTGLSEQQLLVNLSDANGCSGVFTATIDQPPLLTLSTQVISDYNGSQISCPNATDGQSIALPSGGVEPYVFMWEDGSNLETSSPMLTEGTYSVTVMDANGCMAQSETTLNDPTPIELVAQVTSNYNGYNISCYGYSDGTATALASGATPPYSYWWSNGATSPNAGWIPAGAIAAFVTDSQHCDTIQVQLEVIQPESLFIAQVNTSNYNGFGVTCPDATDGWINTIGGGGVPPYQYDWSTNDISADIANLSAGDYGLTLTDQNNCDFDTEYAITEPPALSVNPVVTADTCYQEVGAIQLNASGGAGAIMAEINGEPVVNNVCCLLSSAYLAELVDANGCYLQQIIEVPNVPGPVASFTVSDSPYCSGQTYIDFTDKSEGQVVSWTWNMGDGMNRFENDITHLYDEPGEYNVRLRVMDVNGCVDDTATWLMVSPDLRVFIPNAFSPNQDGDNEAFFPDGSSIVSYEMVVFNRWGEIVFRSTPEMPKWNGSIANANLSSEDGVYSYRITIIGNCETKEVTGHLLLIR